MDNVQTILAALVAGLLVIAAIFLLQSPGSSVRKLASKYYKPTFLVVGANGAGKTSFYYSMLTKETVSTVSSLEPNVTSISLPFANSNILANYQFIDYPGHLKYSQLLRKLIVDDITGAKLKGVIYVIDASSQSLAQEGKLTAMAKELFGLLSLTEKTPNGVDFLFAINKQDLFDSRPVFKVKQMLEEELARVISDVVNAKGLTRGGSGIDNDDDDDSDSFKKEESTREFWRSVVGSSTFRFEMLEGNMEFIGGSVLKSKVSGWENWFDEKVVNYGGM